MAIANWGSIVCLKRKSNGAGSTRKVVTAFAGMLVCAGGAFAGDGYTRLGTVKLDPDQLSVMGRLSLRFGD